MIIRKSTPQDQDQFEKLLIQFDKYTRMYLSPLEQEFLTYKNLKQTVQQAVTDYITNPKNITFIAEEDDVLIGYICGDINERSQRILNKEGYIRDWFVSEAYRNKGIGAQLFDALVIEFRKQACTHLCLKAFIDNKKAIDIYHQMGFHENMIILNKKL